MSFKKKSQAKINIPTSAMPDIIFILLIFFMVTTVMKTHNGLPVKIPEAKESKKIAVSKRNIINLWISKKEEVVCNDFNVKKMPDLSRFIQALMAANGRNIPIIKMDYNAEMGTLIDVQQQLRKGQALRIFYAARPRE